MANFVIKSAAEYSQYLQEAHSIDLNEHRFHILGWIVRIEEEPSKILHGVSALLFREVHIALSDQDPGIIFTRRTPEPDEQLQNTRADSLWGDIKLKWKVECRETEHLTRFNDQFKTKGIELAELHVLKEHNLQLQLGKRYAMALEPKPWMRAICTPFFGTSMEPESTSSFGSFDDYQKLTAKKGWFNRAG